MGVYRFEDLRVWQAAQRQCDRVGELMNRPHFRADGELARQMNDASYSVPFNISEGFLRRNDREFRQFLRYAAASNGELRAAVHAARGRRYLSDAEARELLQENDSLAKQIRKLQQSLTR